MIQPPLSVKIPEILFDFVLALFGLLCPQIGSLATLVGWSPLTDSVGVDVVGNGDSDTSVWFELVVLDNLSSLSEAIVSSEDEENSNDKFEKRVFN